ncbi:hypothetical protein CLCR_10584 [Cladophialophora carrionii]|uniref:Uncharacterized protein n=1 Tax=Cladophialophora carrionii TaxID=86049 RepID=A0A1C1CWH1_9EURO|nr:hypothetical protein CLCR_10584 [Cladophialophora carrionii]
MPSKDSLPHTYSASPRSAQWPSSSFWSPRPRRKCSPSSSASSIPPHQLPPPCSSPPPRPPRPKTSLPNMRPTVILSPQAISRPCILRLPTPNHSDHRYRFSEDVFASLQEHLGLRADGMSSPNVNAGHLTPRSLHVRTEESRALRAMDSFERAIFQSRPANSPADFNPAASSTPLASTPVAIPKPHVLDDISSSYSPTKAEVMSAESDTVYEEIRAGNLGSTVQGRLRLKQHRRLLCMLATVLFVIVAATAIAGGVIWKLTTLGLEKVEVKCACDVVICMLLGTDKTMTLVGRVDLSKRRRL